MTAQDPPRILIDLEKLNANNAEGCLVCGKKFTLGEEVVLARGNWKGHRYIHEYEAIFDEKASEHFELVYYLSS